MDTNQNPQNANIQNPIQPPFQNQPQMQGGPSFQQPQNNQITITQSQNIIQNPIQPPIQNPVQSPMLQAPIQGPVEVSEQTVVQTPVQLPIQEPIEKVKQEIPQQGIQQNMQTQEQNQADQWLQQQMMEQNTVSQPVQQVSQTSSPSFQGTQPQVSQSQMQLQQLLAQQDAYKKQYESIVNFLRQNPNQTPETIAAYKSQLQQLNGAYLQIDTQLKALGYGQQQKVNKPTTIKTGDRANFSLKKLGIGCGIFLVILAIGFGFGINFLVANPDAFASMGITTSTAKSLLSIFAGIFFGVPLLVGLGILISNIYKLITVKNQSKGKFIGGIFGAFLIFGIFGGGIAFVFGKIGEIKVEEKINSNEMVIPYIVGQNDKKIPYTSKIPLIAPAQFAYQVQPALINAYATKNLGEVSVSNVSLHCGNGDANGSGEQILKYGQNGFEGYCLYTKKGTYVINLEIFYTNLLTNEPKRALVPVGNGKLDFISEISLVLANSKKPLEFKNGEFMLGKAPAKITVDSSEVFKDFNLGEYRVKWDLDGDNEIDRENLVNFDYTFKRPKVFYPSFSFPDLSDFVYSFPVRVEQGDIPICDIKLLPIEKTKYKIQTEFYDGVTSSIANFLYTVVDSKTKAVKYTNKEKTLDFSYTFPEVGNYYVALEFVTVDGKKGTCESEPIQMQTEKLTFDTKFSLKGPGERDYKVTKLSGESLSISQIPQEMNFEFVNVSSQGISVEKRVFLDGEAVIDDEGIYHFKFTEEKNHELKIVVEDTEKKLISEKIISIIVKTPDLDCFSFSVTPDQGYEPLKVTLDASKVKLKDPDDSAVYFSFDFGDGEKKENVTNGIMSHTYKYDFQKENGEFSPTVTVRSRKGLTCTQKLAYPIIVKKELVQIELTSPTHPTQIAKVGKTVGFYAEFNGYPETMTWNFGDGTDEYTCKGRNCTEVTHEFGKSGKYTVRLSLDFEDTQSVQKTLTFTIQ